MRWTGPHSVVSLPVPQDSGASSCGSSSESDTTQTSGGMKDLEAVVSGSAALRKPRSCRVTAEAGDYDQALGGPWAPDGYGGRLES